VLCYMQGMRHGEVARRLGCPVGTVESRLSRAREQLRSRLARRGLAPTAAVLASVLLPGKSYAALLPLIKATTLAASLRLSVAAGRDGAAWRGWVKHPLLLKTLPSASVGLLAMTLAVSASVSFVGMDAREAEGTRIPGRDRASVEPRPVAAKEQTPPSP